MNDIQHVRSFALIELLCHCDFSCSALIIKLENFLFLTYYPLGDGGLTSTTVISTVGH